MLGGGRERIHKDYEEAVLNFTGRTTEFANQHADAQEIVVELINLQDRTVMTTNPGIQDNFTF